MFNHHVLADNGLPVLLVNVSDGQRGTLVDLAQLLFLYKDVRG